LYITIIVVFLTAFSIRVGLLSSKIRNGDDTPKVCSPVHQSRCSQFALTKHKQ